MHSREEPAAARDRGLQPKKQHGVAFDAWNHVYLSNSDGEFEAHSHCSAETEKMPSNPAGRHATSERGSGPLPSMVSDYRLLPPRGGEPMASRCGTRSSIRHARLEMVVALCRLLKHLVQLEWISGDRNGVSCNGRACRLRSKPMHTCPCSHATSLLSPLPHPAP